jgi:SAM-dependent methyltransferase
MTSDEAWFEELRGRLEDKYLAGTNPRAQSGFSRDAADWAKYRGNVAACIDRSGTFLDVGCANGHLMESVREWAAGRGHAVEPYGLDMSEKLAELARARLPTWRERIFVGNALHWEPPRRFDFVRTELVYVPPPRRRGYAERLLARFVEPGGRLIVCSYGSSRPEGIRAEPLVDELEAWGLRIGGVEDTWSPRHPHVVTRAVWVVAGGT